MLPQKALTQILLRHVIFLIIYKTSSLHACITSVPGLYCMETLYKKLHFCHLTAHPQNNEPLAGDTTTGLQ